MGTWATLAPGVVMDPCGNVFAVEDDKIFVTPAPPLDDNWMRVAPGTDAAIWRPWSRETGEL